MRYSVYGGCLASEIELPELSPLTSGIPHWTLRLGGARGVTMAETPIGGRQRMGCRVEVSRTASGFRVRHSCVAEYDVSLDGGEIVCFPALGATTAGIKNDLLGRVLPLVFHLRGALCLHASSVVLDGVAVCFIADPRSGKSTLTYALVRAGATLGSDDVVLLEARDDAVVMRAGIDSVRLCSDATRQLVSGRVQQRSPLDGKYVIPLPASADASEDIPLAALYFMSSMNASDAHPAAYRRPIPARAAALLLVRHARLGRVLGGVHAGDVLRRAAAVASRVPAYALHFARDLTRVGAVADEVRVWTARATGDCTGTDG